MAQKRLAMAKIKTILRLHYLGGIMRSRLIARASGCGRTAVQECLKRAKASGLTDWAAIEPLDEDTLEARLYPKSPGGSIKGTRRPLPDWVRVREELSQRDHQVTLALLWQEYGSEHPDGLQYSQFVCRFRQFEKKLSVVMRSHHRPGEKVFVDFCDGIKLTDPVTGDKIPTELFVGTLGASSYTFARATLSQTMPEWLDCHVRMYAAFQGVAAITVPDNLRAGIRSPDRYEAEVTESYQELARHYGTCVIPARVRKPRDKAKVEGAVLVAQRWILAALRHRTFYHLAELNEAIVPLLHKLNTRVMRHVNASRRDLYERLDKPALRPLPDTAYEYAQWRCVRLNIDYHAQFEDHTYSAPMRSSKRPSGCAPLQTRSSSTTRADGWPPTHGASSSTPTARPPNTVRPRTARCLNGRRRGSFSGADRPGLRRARLSATSSPTSPIPSKAIARRSASCGYRRRSGVSVSSAPPPGRFP